MRRILSRVTLAVLLVVITALLGGFVCQWSAARSEQSKIPMPGRLVKIDGLSLHLHCVGHGGPIMVVDAGAGNWSIHWAHIQNALSRDGRVCLYDRAGQGWSDAWAGDRTGANLSLQLHELLEASGEAAPYILVGHSLGGYVARLFENRYPDKVAGIAFVDSAHEDQFQVIVGLESAIKAADTPLTIATLMARFGLFRIMDVPLDVELPDSASQTALVAALKTPKHWKSMRAIVLKGPAVAEELRRIDSDLGGLPLVVISAGASAQSYCEQLALDCVQTQQTWNRLQQALLRLSTDSRQVVCPVASHNIQLDDPECVLEALSSFRRDVRLPAVLGKL